MEKFGWGSSSKEARRIGLLVIALVLELQLTQAADLSKAEDLYKHTEFKASLALLDKQSNDAATNFLIARNYFMLGDAKKAVDFLQIVTTQQPQNAEYMDWLGRAYGKRAETSNPFMAPGFASKARQAFEKAVDLDPRNKDALSDLFDYYLEAPGFLGGGQDKALAIAGRTAKFDPGQAYFEQAKVAQKRKEFETAEYHFRQAINLVPQGVGHLVALASFLANQGRGNESDAIFLEAQTKYPNSPQVWFAWASALVKQKRNLGDAKNMLEKYVRASITPDDPPKQEARRLLKEAGGA